MVTTQPGQVTRLLRLAAAGRSDALEALLPVVYDEMRRLARRQLGRERADHTLQPTALVHETYLRLLRQDSLGCDDRGRFFAVAAGIMRRILTDHARRRRAHKRGSGRRLTVLDEALDAFEARSRDLVALDDALNELAAVDARKARLVELRFFGGMTLPEAADTLEISLRTAERDWTLARAWLHQCLVDGDDPPGDTP